MGNRLKNEWVKNLLACPYCMEPFSGSEQDKNGQLICQSCSNIYGVSEVSGCMDLRCPGIKKHTITLSTGSAELSTIWESTIKNAPSLIYEGNATQRTSKAILSVIKENVEKGGTILDIGCGAAEYRPLVQSLGIEYIGVDFNSKSPDMLADVHCLPFRKECFDAVIMHGALQAFENPFIACSEVSRVLKYKGLILSSSDSGAAFVDSYFHITPMGVISILYSQGFEIERMWIAKDALSYFGTNPGYPRLIRYILRLLSKLSAIGILTPRNFIRKVNGNEFITAGSFFFTGRKKRKQ